MPNLRLLPRGYRSHRKATTRRSLHRPRLVLSLRLPERTKRPLYYTVRLHTRRQLLHVSRAPTHTHLASNLSMHSSRLSMALADRRGEAGRKAPEALSPASILAEYLSFLPMTHDMVLFSL